MALNNIPKGDGTGGEIHKNIFKSPTPSSVEVLNFADTKAIGIWLYNNKITYITTDTTNTDLEELGKSYILITARSSIRVMGINLETLAENYNFLSNTMPNTLKEIFLERVRQNVEGGTEIPTNPRLES